MKLNENELSNVTGGSEILGGSDFSDGAEVGSKVISGKQNIPMLCQKASCSKTFYISSSKSVVQCPHCKHLYVING